MSEIRRLIQKPFPGVEVDMYDIDLTSKGGKLMHFTNWVLEDGEKIKWRGNTYEPIALEVKGFAATSEGKPPRPKMKVANAVFEGGLTESLSTLAAEFDDFVGCKVVRWRTYRQFLDDGEQADPGTYFPLDEYIVSSKLEETPVAIEWELAMPLDQEGLMIPRIVMTQNIALGLTVYGTKTKRNSSTRMLYAPIRAKTCLRKMTNLQPIRRKTDAPRDSQDAVCGLG